MSVIKEYLMKGAFVEQSLHLYRNGIMFFGQKGTYFFRLNRKNIVQLNANDPLELETYNTWKFSKWSKEIEKEEPIYMEIDKVLMEILKND